MGLIKEKLECELCGWHGTTGELVIVDNELTCPSCCGEPCEQIEKTEETTNE